MIVPKIIFEWMRDMIRAPYTAEPEWRRNAKADGKYFKEGRATFKPEPAAPSRQVKRRMEIIAAKKAAHAPKSAMTWREVRDQARA